MTTRQHLSSQPRKVTTCFVLDDCGDDSETFANLVNSEVSLSVESTKQTSPTPIAFNAVDTREKNILNIHTADDDDGPRSSGDEHKSDRNTRFENRTYRGMLSGDVFTRLSTTSCVIDKSRERIDRHVRISLLDTRTYGVDATIPVSSRKKVTSSERSSRFVARFENSVVHRDWTQLPVSHDIRRRHTAPIVETILLSFLTKATSPTAQPTLSASTNPDRRFTDLALKDTKITERQFDPAKERMLEQVLLLSGGIISDQ